MRRLLPAPVRGRRAERTANEYQLRQTPLNPNQRAYFAALALAKRPELAGHRHRRPNLDIMD